MGNGKGKMGNGKGSENILNLAGKILGRLKTSGSPLRQYVENLGYPTFFPRP